ncbi:hypothetical protein BGZ83_008741 [Gryganskiella cystojenkinii]|nr:hypothetical protein BGZ83_008741 [Gryganskiella cystojenkinii]
MSSVNEHKRKASDSEAHVLESTTSDHDSKKARKDEPAQHADDCEDPDCEGCAEGEIVLQFETTPSAVELFQMAREEASSKAEQTGSGGGMSRMAKALFDKAIEEFEAEDKKYAHIELSDKTEVAEKVLEIKVQHAACVLAVGNLMPSSEMIQEGLRMFADLKKLTKEENGNVLVGLGIAEISLVGEKKDKQRKNYAKDLRRTAMEVLEQEEEDDEDEPSEEQQKAAALVGKKEKETAERALKIFTKGLHLLKDKPSFAQESVRTAQELEEYGVSLDPVFNRDLALQILDQAIKHIEEAQSTKAELVDKNADVLTIYGSCVFSKARLSTPAGEDFEDQSAAKPLLVKAIEILLKAEELHDEEDDYKTLETLGQAYLMSSVLTEDEDAIMEAYDAATDRLSRALELNPGNDSLRQQVEAMQGGADGEEYEGESDDENDEEFDEEEQDGGDDDGEDEEDEEDE